MIASLVYQISYRYLKPFISYRGLKHWTSDAHVHTQTHTSGRQLKITFLDVLDYSEYSDTNISNFFFHWNITSSVRKQNENIISSWDNCCGDVAFFLFGHASARKKSWSFRYRPGPSRTGKQGFQIVLRGYRYKIRNITSFRFFIRETLFSWKNIFWNFHVRTRVKYCRESNVWIPIRILFYVYKIKCLENIWLKFYVYQSKLDKVQVNSPVSDTVSAVFDAYGHRCQKPRL